MTTTLHRGRTGAEQHAQTRAIRPRPAPATGAPALELGRDGAAGGGAIRPSGRAMVIGLLAGVAVIALLSVLAVVR